MLGSMLVLALILNYNIFDNYFSDVPVFMWSTLVTFLILILTFLNEGVAQFERYKTTLIETEQLKKEYLHSQLLGLKSQMNPHFLFNSLNTLSCLIQEDEEKAEDFLDHMSKVYRYLLRNEEQLVSLETEVDMVRSYYFLLKKRHSDALTLEIAIPKSYLNSEIPPLTLQMIVENAVNQNSLTKNEPLIIKVKAVNDEIEIQY